MGKRRTSARAGLSLGIDLGTTAVKATAVDARGKVVAFGSAPTRLITGPGGLVEQDVAEIWQDVVKAVRAAFAGGSLGGDVRAISLSSQGGTLILLDANGTPVCNAISWMDSRPARLGAKIFRGRDEAFFYERTGWGLASCLPLAQLVRLAEEERGVLRRARCVHFVDSYVVERLTGRGVCDPSDAAITMLCDVRAGQWDDELMTIAGVASDMLPALRDSGTAVGAVLAAAAEEMGISPEAAVVAGGHDQYCAAYGAGCRAAGDTIVSCGTAWVVLTMTTEPRFHPAARLGPAKAVAAGLWGLLGSSPTGGASVDWFRRACVPAGDMLPFEKLEAAAAATEPSASAAVFVPPHGGAGREGRFLGLGMHHGFGDLARAVLEGAAMSARVLIGRMELAGAAPSVLRAVGGATRSRPWMQILSDATGLPLEVAGVQEAASFGAAMLAGRSAGLIAPEIGWPEPSYRVEPREALRGVYAELYRRYTEGSR